MDKLAHAQVVIICRYFVAQLCTREDMLNHYLGAVLDDTMSQNELTTHGLNNKLLVQYLGHGLNNSLFINWTAFDHSKTRGLFTMLTTGNSQVFAKFRLRNNTLKMYFQLIF